MGLGQHAHHAAVTPCDLPTSCPRPSLPTRRRCPPTFHSAFIDGSHRVVLARRRTRNVVLARCPAAHVRSPAFALADQPLPGNIHSPTARRRPVPDRL
jgi:hypothetical protein